MALLISSQVHLDVPLTNFTMAYLQSTTGFVADKVFPRVSVDKQSNKYYKYDREHFNRGGEVQARAARTESQEVSFTISNDNYFCDVFSLGSSLSIEVMANEDAALNARQAAIEQITMQMMIDKERKWASTYFATGIWGTEYTGVSGAPTGSQVRQWSDYTNSTPIIDITAASRAMQLKSGGFKPNVMVVGKEVRDQLINHPTILARLNGGATVTNTALVTDAKLAEIFGVEEFLVMEAVYNTSVEGVAESNAFIGGKSAALFYRPRTVGMMSAVPGICFSWDNLPEASGYGLGVTTYRGDWLLAKRIAEKVEINMAYDQKVTSSDLGVFFATVIA